MSGGHTGTPMKYVTWADHRGQRFCTSVAGDQRWIVTYESGGMTHMRTFATTRSRDGHLDWLHTTGARNISTAEC